MSAGSFYSHFESKTELVQLVARRVLSARKDALEEARERGEEPLSPSAVLTEFFTEMSPRNAKILLQV